MNQKALKDFRSYLTQPVSASTLVFFRIFFGGILLWEVFRYWPRIARYYIYPMFHFTYDFFHWVEPWQGDGMYIHFVIAGIAAGCVVLGLFFRFAAIILFLSFSYFFLAEQANYLNHMYFVNLMAFLLIFTDAHRCFSIDALFFKNIRSGVVPYWNILILRFQVGVVYFFGGVAKLNMDWLQGEPLRHWLAKRGDYDYIGPFLTEWWSPYFFSWGGLLLDLFVPFLLLWKRTRLLAVLGVMFFHLMNSYIFSIGIFPWMMLAATIIFFDPDCLEKLIPKRAREKTLSFSLSTVGYSLLILYAAVQIFMPLRHWLYPDDVVWTEEGHKFAWRMKLRDKSSRLAIFIHDPDTNRKFYINPVRSGHLLSRQYGKMKGRPDMFFQYIQFLKKKLKEQGIENPIINARYEVSVNGRPYQWVVDPKRDLNKITYSTFTHYDWLLPMKPNQTIGNYSRLKRSPEPLQ